MTGFFDYRSPYRTGIFLELTIWEHILPIIVIGICAYLIYRYRESITIGSSLDKAIRYGLGIGLAIFYLSHYLFRFHLYGFDTIILPFHLCGIAMAFAIVLLFTNNKTIYSFVLMTGVLGSVISFATPVIGYDSAYYRYYQFFFAHGILFITPLYYLFVYHWFPSKKEILNSYIILQILIVFMGTFNYFMGTDFMFVFVDPAKIEKFEMIKYLGGIPYYIIVGEVFLAGYFYGSYLLFDYLNRRKDA